MSLVLITLEFCCVRACERKRMYVCVKERKHVLRKNCERENVLLHFTACEWQRERERAFGCLREKKKLNQKIMLECVFGLEFLVTVIEFLLRNGSVLYTNGVTLLNLMSRERESVWLFERKKVTSKRNMLKESVYVHLGWNSL